MEKTITLRNTEITFSIWDLGGQREFLSMLPLVSGQLKPAPGVGEYYAICIEVFRGKTGSTSKACQFHAAYCIVT